MTIQMTSSGINIKRLRSDAKKLAKAEKIKLHEAQNRIAEQVGEGAWDRMMRGAWMFDPDDLRLFRKTDGVVSRYRYYDLLEMADLVDSLSEMDDDDWDSLSGACHYELSRGFAGMMDDDIVHDAGGRTAVINRFDFDLGENYNATIGDLTEDQRNELRAAWESKSLRQLAVWLLSIYDDCQSWLEDERVEVDSDLQVAETQADKGFSEDDCVFDPMVSIGGNAISTKVYYVEPKNEYAVVSTSNRESDDIEIAWLTPGEWEQVWDRIVDRCASPVGDATSVMILRKVLSGEFEFKGTTEERIERWLDAVTFSEATPHITAAQWRMGNDIEEALQDAGIIPEDGDIETAFDTDVESQVRLGELLVEYLCAGDAEYFEKRLREQILDLEKEAEVNQSNHIPEWELPEDRWLT